MVPLDKIGGGAGRGAIVVKPPRPAPEKPPAARRPRHFRVVDVMTRQPLLEDAGVRETLDLLSKQRSVVDVSVYVRIDGETTWRRLSQREQRILWEGRNR
jgi:hypothetical protein